MEGLLLLAFNNPELVQTSKISILLGSLLAGAAGYLILHRQAGNASEVS